MYASYGDLVEQAPVADPNLELPPPANIGMGPHLFYALQWWSFIAIALIGYLVLVRREARTREAAGPDGAAAADLPQP